jgi:tetratricopeptide (TPR) repeat protein/TolB-like protein
MCGNPLEDFSEVSSSHALPGYGPHLELAPGTTFAGRYEIIEELGRGGMGVIYKAEDTKLKRNVALKFLPWELTRDPVAKERFVHEAQAASSIEHPNICTVHEIDETDEGQMYISMSCYDGETLKARVEREPLKLEEAVDIGVQVAQGLREAHEKGIVHRDIKPSNIMVTSKGQAKIMDFGLAKLAGGTRLTKAGTTMGTIAYMSPEQANGEDVDERSDLWSLGAVLYEMVSGTPPFKGEYDQAVIYSILNEEPKAISESGISVPGGYEKVVRKSLAKDPTQRYQSAAELELDLRRFRKESGLTELTTVTKVWAGRYPSRRRLPWKVVPAIIVILALVVLALVPQSRKVIMGLLSPGLAEADMRIAVLPCNLEDGTPEDRAFCDGLATVLAGKLGDLARQRQTFWIVPAQDVQEFMGKGESHGAVDAWREFQANVIITGDVHRTDDVIRLTPLRNDIVIEDRDGVPTPTVKQEQGPRISDPIANLSTWQDGIVADVADLLDLDLSPEELIFLSEQNTTVPHAYEFYVRGLGYKTPYGQKNERDLDAAIAALEQATEHDPSYALAHIQLGLACESKYKDTDEELWAQRALDSYQNGLQVDDRIALTHITIGMLYTDLGRFDEAAQHLRQALEIDPDYDYAHYALGYMYKAQGRADSTEACFLTTVELNPRAYNTHYELMFVYYSQHKYEKALEHLLKMAEIKPNEPGLYTALGVVYSELQRTGEAREMFEKSLAIDSESESAYRPCQNLGTLYFRGHRYADAARMYRKALDISNADYAVWGHLAEAYYWSPGERDTARVTFEHAIRLGELALEDDQDNPTTLINLASYHAKLDNDPRALSFLEQAVALEPSGSDDMLHVAETYEDLGERAIAFEWIERALDKGASTIRVEEYPGLSGLRASRRYRELIEGVSED